MAKGVQLLQFLVKHPVYNVIAACRNALVFCFEPDSVAGHAL